MKAWFTEAWLPIGTLGLALVLSWVMAPSARALGLRGHGQETGPRGCHVRTEKNPQELCEVKVNGKKVDEPCEDKDPPEGKFQMRTYKDVRPDGSAAAFASIRSPIVLPSGNKIGLIGEFVRDVHRWIRWSQGHPCPHPPCHPLSSRLEAILELKTTVSPPTRPGDFGEAVADGSATARLEADNCGAPFWDSASIRVIQRLKRKLDPLTMEVIDEGMLEESIGLGSRRITLTDNDPQFRLVGDTIDYLSGPLVQGTINVNLNFERRSELSWRINVCTASARAPLEGIATARSRFTVEVFTHDDLGSPP